MTRKIFFASFAIVALALASISTTNASSAFTSTGAMTSAHPFATATSLHDGTVLVVGGIDAAGALDSAELFDPLTRTFSLKGSLHTGRYFHSASLLADGRVFVVGGVGPQTGPRANDLNSFEIYNPARGLFDTMGTSAVGSEDAAAITLLNGDVLVIEGECCVPPQQLSDAAGMYDPYSEKSSLTGSIAILRIDYTTTLLANGRVLVAGGSTYGSVLDSAEVFDPDQNGFTTLPSSMSSRRQSATATLLVDGKVLIAGGADNSGSCVSSAELFDPTTNSFLPTGSLESARCDAAAILLDNGKVMIAGGDSALNNGAVLDSVELFDPQTGTFASAGALTTPRIKAMINRLNDGRILISGGLDSSGALSSAETYDRLFSGTFEAIGL